VRPEQALTVSREHMLSADRTTTIASSDTRLPRCAGTSLERDSSPETAGPLGVTAFRGDDGELGGSETRPSTAQSPGDWV